MFISLKYADIEVSRHCLLYRVLLFVQMLNVNPRFSRVFINNHRVLNSFASRYTEQTYRAPFIYIWLGAYLLWNLY